jgi:hypothetical protein
MTAKKKDVKPADGIKADVNVLRHIDDCIGAVEVFNQKIGRLHPADLALDVKALNDMIEGAVLFAQTLVGLRAYARKLKPLGVRTYTVREATRKAQGERPEDCDLSSEEWEELNRDWTPEEWDKWEKECDEKEAHEKQDAEEKGAWT